MNIEDSVIILKNIKKLVAIEWKHYITDTELSAIETLLTAYEKQQKEIEELKGLKFENERTIDLFIEGYKRIYKELDIKSLVMNENILINEIKENFTSNDKIKAKLKELKQEKSEYEDSPEWELFDYLTAQIEVLQSLLEKEVNKNV